MVNILTSSLKSGPLWLLDEHGPTAMVYSAPPTPDTQAIEQEVRAIYSNLIASYTRLRELRRLFFASGQDGSADKDES